MRASIVLFGWLGTAFAVSACMASTAQDGGLIGPAPRAIEAEPSPGEPSPRNVLLVVMDDIGKELIGCCPGSAEDAKTPRLDAFALSGVRFDNVWSNPACSPTRATILTGRYGFRTGIGAVLRKDHPVVGLRSEEVCIPEALERVSPAHQTALIGKWHLGVKELGVEAPRLQGFDVFRGTRGNLAYKAKGDTYFSYEEVHNGELAQRETYATTATVDDTLATIEDFGEKPWFVMASFHAAHKPVHAPPKHLHSRELSGAPFRSNQPHCAAVVEAFDTEFGRMLDSLSEEIAANTTIIVVADNGSSSWARSPDLQGNSGKGSLFEDGVCVPMFVGGAGVNEPGRVVSHPINTTDIYDTVLELCSGEPSSALPRGGAEKSQPSAESQPEPAPDPALESASEPARRDSTSFLPYLESANAPALREWIMAERFLVGRTPQKPVSIDRVALKLGRFKLVEDRVAGDTRLYDLEADPMERVNLLREEAEASPEALAGLDRMKRILKDELKRRL